MSHTLFLSHNAADLSLVNELKRRSEAAGVTVYTYEDDVQAGQSLAQKLMAAIRRSDGLVAVLTKTGVARPTIQQEIGAAVALGKPVYAIIEEGVEASTMTFLQGIEYIRLDIARMEEALIALQRSITARQTKQRREIVLAMIAIFALFALLSVATHD